MSEVTIASLVAEKERLSKVAELIESHDRLLKNKDFKKLIMEGFMVNECARYVQQSCDPMLTDRQRADALAIAQAAGHLKRYLQISYHMAQDAVGAIQRYDEQIEEMRNAGEDE